jgi:prepilin-type N-terminal cleavage/methylation domain-containing protein
MKKIIVYRNYNRTNRRMVNGFTLMEVLVSLAILGAIALSLFCIHTSSWIRVTKSNRMMIASQLIEKQIEKMRMDIAIDSVSNWPPESGTATANGIILNWIISSANRPSTCVSGAGAVLNNVRRCDLSAVWGTGKGDTLKITTYLSKMF